MENKEKCKKHGVIHKNGGYPSCSETKPCEIEPENLEKKVVEGAEKVLKEFPNVFERLRKFDESEIEPEKIDKIEAGRYVGVPKPETPQPPIDWEDEFDKMREKCGIYLSGIDIHLIKVFIRTHKKIWEDEAYEKGFQEGLDVGSNCDIGE